MQSQAEHGHMRQPDMQSGPADAPAGCIKNADISTGKDSEGELGLITVAFTGVLGKLPLISFQCAPPSIVRKTWPSVSPKPLNPEKATYAVLEVAGSTAISRITGGGKDVLLR